jgi:caspase 7
MRKICFSFLSAHLQHIFVVVVMTHGEENLLHGRDKPYETHKVWELFTANKCPSLARKPKVFIFQVCKTCKT